MCCASGGADGRACLEEAPSRDAGCLWLSSVAGVTQVGGSDIQCHQTSQTRALRHCSQGSSEAFAFLAPCLLDPQEKGGGP